MIQELSWKKKQNKKEHSWPSSGHGHKHTVIDNVNLSGLHALCHLQYSYIAFQHSTEVAAAVVCLIKTAVASKFSIFSEEKRG